MAVIYEISTGHIISENSGVTMLDQFAGRKESNTPLHPDQATVTTEETDPCDAYMSVIRELLREL